MTMVLESIALDFREGSVRKLREREKGLEEINKPECAGFGEN